MRKDGYINPITEVLSKIYVKDGIDIFNYLITEENFITYHHVIKCEDLKGLEFSKEKTIENGVALSHFGHGYFHYIEEFAPDIYFHINKILLLLAKERRIPTNEERNLLQILFEAFEYRMEGYRKIPEHFLVRERKLVIS